MVTIGANIKRIRKEKKLSQRELGEKLGVSQQMIGQYENNTTPPKYETVKRIAKALGVPTSEIDPRADISTLEEALEELRKQKKEALQSFTQDEIFGDKFNAIYNRYKQQEAILCQQLKSLTKDTERQHLYETTGETIKKLRLKKGLTLTDMSSQTKLPISLLYRIENNLRSLNLDTLVKISKCLGVAAVDIDPNTVFEWGFGKETEADKLYNQLLNYFENLNHDGQKKAVEQLELLSKISDYQVTNPEKDIPSSK